MNSSLKCVFAATISIIAYNVLGGGVIALYRFNEGAAGTEVQQIKNAVDEGLYGSDKVKASVARDGVPGGVPVYSDDIPAKYIYANSSATEPLMQEGNYQSISTADALGYVHLANIFSAAAKSESGDFTLELFIKTDTHDGKWRNFITTEGTTDSDDAEYFKLATTEPSTQICLQQIANREGNFHVYNNTHGVGVWSHVVIIYDHEVKKAEWYVNGQKSSTLDLDLSGLPEGKGMFLLGSPNGTDYIQGKVACVRLCDGKLDKDEFLQALPFKLNNSDPLFYDFKDGTAGETVNAITNTIDPNFGTATAVSMGGGAKPVFDDDVPGTAIQTSLYDHTIMAQHPLSISFAGDESSPFTGGVMQFPGLAYSLSVMPEYTIEFFAKIPSTTASWRSMISYSTGIRDSADGGDYAVYMQWPSAGLGRISLQNWNHPGGNQEGLFWEQPTNVWMHFAIVYKDNKATPYCNYVSSSSIDIDHGSLTMFTPLYLGGAYSANNNAFIGKLCCLRITPKALEATDFMRAITPQYGEFHNPDTVFMWHLNGEDGADVTTETDSLTGLPMLNGTGKTYKSRLPTYSTSAIRSSSPYLYTGENLPANRLTGYTNTACARFYGRDNEAGYGSWAGSYIETKPDSSDFMNPTNWTMELFFKTSGAQVEGDALLMGKGYSDNYRDWLVSISTDGKLTAGFCGTEWVMNTPTILSWSPVSQTRYDDQRWHHLALTYDAGTLTAKLYVDYKLIKEGTLPSELGNHGENCYRFGRYCSMYGFNGYLDEIRFSSRVLTPDEFLRLGGERATLIILR